MTSQLARDPAATAKDVTRRYVARISARTPRNENENVVMFSVRSDIFTLRENERPVEGYDTDFLLCDLPADTYAPSKTQSGENLL